MTLPYAIRAASEADLGYVWNTLAHQWSRKDAPRWAQLAGHALPAELVQRRERTLARHVLGEAYVRVAYPEESPGVVCAFLVFDPLIQTVHYAYTGPSFRHFGIMRRLLADATHGWEVIHASHLTKPGRTLVARLTAPGQPLAGRTVRFDPYRAFFARELFVRPQDGTAGNAIHERQGAEPADRANG